MMAGRTAAAGYDAFTYHGGALEVARRLQPHAPTPRIDLSTGVNPHPYPLLDRRRLAAALGRPVAP
jgi:cobalamin biosynthetic protein CobC